MSSWGPLFFLSSRTYGLYLVHLFTWPLGVSILEFFGFTIKWLFILITLGATVALSVLLEWFVERPFNQIKTRI